MSEEDKHQLVSYVDRPKFSALNLVAARCSCGFESAPGNRRDGTKAWLQHMLDSDRNEKLEDVPLFDVEAPELPRDTR